jgi:hypothetical protein
MVTIVMNVNSTKRGYFFLMMVHNLPSREKCQHREDSSNLPAEGLNNQSGKGDDLIMILTVNNVLIVITVGTHSCGL